MLNSKTLYLYSEIEKISIIKVSDPKRAEIIITKDGSVNNSLNEIIPEKFSKNQLEKDISDLFTKIGISPHHNGYFYSKEAVIMLIDDPKLINSVRKILYPKIAKIFNKIPMHIEQGIKYAIEKTFTNGDLKFQKNFFGVPIDFDKYKPKNSEFLFYIAEHFRLQEKYNK